MKMIGRVITVLFEQYKRIAPIWTEENNKGIMFSPLKMPSRIMTDILRETLIMDRKAKVKINGSAERDKLTVALRIEASSKEKGKEMIKIVAPYTELAKGFKKYAIQHLNFNDKDFEEIEGKRAVILLGE